MTKSQNFSNDANKAFEKSIEIYAQWKALFDKKPSTAEENDTLNQLYATVQQYLKEAAFEGHTSAVKIISVNVSANTLIPELDELIKQPLVSRSHLFQQSSHFQETKLALDQLIEKSKRIFSNTYISLINKNYNKIQRATHFESPQPYIMDPIWQNGALNKLKTFCQEKENEVEIKKIGSTFTVIAQTLHNRLLADALHHVEKNKFSKNKLPDSSSHKSRKPHRK